MSLHTSSPSFSPPYTINDVTGLQTDLDGKASLANVNTFTNNQIISKANSTGITDLIINPSVKTGGNFVDYQVNGVSKFTISYTGRLDNNLIVCAGPIYGSIISVGGGNSSFVSNVSGKIVLYDSLSTGFSMLQFGGLTGLNPALKKNGVNLEAKTADDLFFTGFTADSLNAISYVSTVQIYSGGSGTTRFGNNALFGNLSSGTVHSSSTVEIRSTTLGFLPPRHTTIQKNAVIAPSNGLMVYDSDLASLSVYNGSWKTLLLESTNINVTGVNIGGIGAGRPMIVNNGAIAQFKTGDGLGFTEIQGKLMTDEAYTISAIEAIQGYIIIRASDGQRHKVLSGGIA